MTKSAVKPGEWVTLWTVAGMVLLGLLAVASLPAVCAISGPCSQGARVLPAALGSLLVVAVAVAASVVAHRSAGRVRDGVRRSEGVVAGGITAILLVGVAFGAAALFSAGFALVI
ncbi:hypothetical protein [Microbacterium timonense]|uniref:hypothetical protein n=1 Tax=Microbacterium timonense TaxID=2086576 RepID=UPI000D0EE6DF|nr:hypothetical protein [Microbacterium timonense]